ncbi:hypothetical protein [Halobellus sp. GM3]|uniref:hypothetical protein n=1 Tax=Halobellus sp. GM3 TaxID=3458410 RepID=UPI00403DE0E8
MTKTPFESETRGVERWDDVFSALANGVRRQLIIALLDAGPSGSVALPECASGEEEPTDPERLRVELCHRHLPMLAKHGYVEWGTDPFIASWGPRFDELAKVVERLFGTAREMPDSLSNGSRHSDCE